MSTISLPSPSLHNNTNSLFLPRTTTTTTTTCTTTPVPSPPPPRAMEAVEIRRVFEMFDQNGDGRISKGELTSSLKNMGIMIPEEELGLMISRIDVNGDGCVDGAEFEALYRVIMEEREHDELDEEEDMKEAFSVFDKNGDGFIEVDELRTVLASLGLAQARSLDDCKLMIMKVDVDGDGRVSFKEFKKMMKAGGLAAMN